MKLKELLEKQVASELEACLKKIHDELSKNFDSTDKLRYSCQNSALCFIGEKEDCRIYIGTPHHGTLIGIFRPCVITKVKEQLEKEGFTSHEAGSATYYEFI